MTRKLLQKARDYAEQVEICRLWRAWVDFLGLTAYNIRRFGREAV